MHTTTQAQRLGRNQGGYHGETIAIDAVLKGTLAAAARWGWKIETFYQAPSVELVALHRSVRSRDTSHPTSRTYLSAGIHGDEPAGPLAIRRLIEEDAWPANAEIWACPCLNPAGFRLNRRENEHGVDLNRQYLHLEAPEIAAHVEWLKRQPLFDRTICIHEDWESHGFYLYELNPDDLPSPAERIVEAVKPVCPLDLSAEIEGRPASGGIIRPSTDPRSRPQWPEAFHLLTYKTRLSYTLEAPSDFPLEMRVRALVAAVRAAI